MNLAAISTRLRDLDKKGELDKMLAPRDEGLPWADIVWGLHWFAGIGAIVQIVRLVLAKANANARVSDADGTWLLLLFGLAIVMRFGSRLLRTKTQRLRKKLRRHGLVVPAAVVQANDAYHEPDNDKWLPGSMLLSFDPSVIDRPEVLERVAKRILRLKRADRRTLPPDQAALAWDLYHEMGPTASLPVPNELTEGLRDCIVASVMLPPRPLRAGSLFVCFALPGESSPCAVVVVPENAAA